MKAQFGILSIILILMLVYTSCEPLENASDVPAVTFKSFDLYQTYDDKLEQYILQGELVFDFVDGDANVGIKDTASDEQNLFLVPYQKLNKEYDSIDATLYGLNYTILDNEGLHRDGKYTTIKGEIKVMIPYSLVPPFDTLRYDFYLVDRDGNKSNVESTSDIAF
jgi:hypothetical protein